MRLIEVQTDQYRFEIGRVEKQLLLHVLGLYPLVPPTHHRLSQNRELPDHDANQQLLEEALKAQRLENQKELATLLKQPKRFIPGKDGFQLTLARGEIEWLMQVLNDVRVGSRIALGSPDYDAEERRARDDSATPHAATMDLAGAFEMVFLDALTGQTGGE